METKEKPKGPNDPREYVADPNAGKKLCVYAAVVVIVTGIIGSGMWLVIRSAMENAAPSSTVFITALCMVLVAVGVFILWHFTRVAFRDFSDKRSGRIRDWFASYFRRNVRGYVVAHTTYNYGISRTGFTDPFPRGSMRATEITKTFSFVVLWPLGGWFARPQTFWRGRRSKWTVTPINGRHPTATVRVTDGLGSSLRFATLKDATDILAVQLELARLKPNVLDTATDMPFSWLQILEGLSEDRDDARRDRGLAERDREEAERQRAELERQMTVLFDRLHTVAGNPPFDPARPLMERIEDALRQLIVERNFFRGERGEAIKFVDGLAQEIEQGSRLSGTIEALRLLDRMLNWLCWATVKDSPEHRAVQDRLAVVRTKLAEKQKHDRRRHGRKPAATPAT